MNTKWKNAEGKLTGTAKAAIIGGAVVVLAIAAISGTAAGSTPAAPSAATHETATATPAPTKTAAPTPTPTPTPTPKVGTSYATAAPVGTPITSTSVMGNSKYETTFGEVVFDATALVKQTNMFNEEPPAGEKYLVATVTVKNIGTEEVSPGTETMDIVFVAPDGTAYQQPFSTVLPKPISGTVAPPGTVVTGQIAFLVPATVTEGAFASGSVFVRAN